MARREAVARRREPLRRRRLQQREMLPQPPRRSCTKRKIVERTGLRGPSAVQPDDRPDGVGKGALGTTEVPRETARGGLVPREQCERLLLLYLYLRLRVPTGEGGARPRGVV